MGEEKLPRLYIDTNVFLDVIENRKGKEYSKNLMDLIKTEKWYCCTSVFGICETIDIEQEFMHQENLRREKYTIDDIIRRRKDKKLTQTQRDDALDKVRVFLLQYNIEQFVLANKGWETAFTILRDLNISAPDAVHLATAIENNCTLFITNDGDMEKEARKKIPSLSSKRAFFTFQKR